MLKFCLYNVGYQSISFGFGTHNSLRPRFDLKI
ncbi:unknown [Prevotella sp. CAG:5226]|nr:unknown [Prevotella sp. CAG:5226]